MNVKNWVINGRYYFIKILYHYIAINTIYSININSINLEINTLNSVFSTYPRT